ncbi:DUF1328 domain-containing protein [Salidesulfovibrio brasiliensis]|uniref:DUF1328 domain-containing protein n=1 Tax=Salidesulfovibrio brasiliensis TaxID=221711 RepID=UPI003F71C08D
MSEGENHLSSGGWIKTYNRVLLKVERTFNPFLGGQMLFWTVVFFIIALVAGIFGFGGISAAAAGIAKLLFFIFIIAFIVSLIMGRRRRMR